MFKFLDKLYGFDIDGAADTASALCPVFYDEEVINAFDQRPQHHVIWCNPPYGGLGPWMDLFAAWGKSNVVVALVPAAPDTVWWKRGADTATETILLSPGRVQFVDPETGAPAKNNTTASTLFIYDPLWPPVEGMRRMDVWDWRRDVFD